MKTIITSALALSMTAMLLTTALAHPDEGNEGVPSALHPEPGNVASRFGTGPGQEIAGAFV